MQLTSTVTINPQTSNLWSHSYPRFYFTWIMQQGRHDKETKCSFSFQLYSLARGTRRPGLVLMLSSTYKISLTPLLLYMWFRTGRSTTQKDQEWELYTGICSCDSVPRIRTSHLARPRSYKIPEPCPCSSWWHAATGIIHPHSVAWVPAEWY